MHCDCGYIQLSIKFHYKEILLVQLSQKRFIYLPIYMARAEYLLKNIFC